MFVGAFGALLMVAAPIPIVRGGECFFAFGADSSSFRSYWVFDAHQEDG